MVDNQKFLKLVNQATIKLHCYLADPVPTYFGADALSFLQSYSVLDGTEAHDKHVLHLIWAHQICANQNGAA
ncbi:MAG: hypothetical protein ACXWJK_11310 [Burkholderiaceae bacterium]